MSNDRYLGLFLKEYTISKNDELRETASVTHRAETQPIKQAAIILDALSNLIDVSFCIPVTLSSNNIPQDTNKKYAMNDDNNAGIMSGLVRDTPFLMSINTSTRIADNAI